MHLRLLALVIAFVFLAVAAWYDSHFQIIPNWLNASAAVTAVMIWGAQSQWGLVFKNIGIGLAIGVLFHIIGLVGAGDAKAMAALSGLVGLDTMLLTVICAFIILVLWALPRRVMKLGFKGFLKSEWQGLKYFLLMRRLRPNPEDCPPEIEKVPLAPFFLPGYIVAVLLLWRWFYALV